MQQKYLWGLGVIAALLIGGGAIVYYGRPVMQNDYSASISPTVSLSASPATTASVSPTVTTSESPVASSSPTVSASSTPGQFSMANVQAHATESSCWTTIDGGVYDLTSWISRHPGGPGPILGLCGTDGTDKFTRKHGNSGAAKAALGLLKIGVLK